ncbi:MAG TPA: hypothetical protein VF838_15350 [Trebonia sp.]
MRSHAHPQRKRRTEAEFSPGQPRCQGSARAGAGTAALIRRILDGNARFAALWHEGTIAGHIEDRKTVRHLDIGDITVDCDVLHDTDTDLKIVIYTAARAARTRPSWT